MSERSAQIYEPQTGRSYRVLWKDKTFIGRVTGWALETVDLTVIDPLQSGLAGDVQVTRIESRFEEWL